MSTRASAAVIVIVGPTASGKSDVAQRVALAIDGEIVSADSMQVYRGMDIGTAKLPPAARSVAHHGLDLVNPDEDYSAALFQRYARTTFDEIRDRGHRPMLVGGTGLYVRAALDDLEFAPGEQRGNALRASLQTVADTEGAEALWRRLFALDPSSAELIHPNNVRRVIRAIEMYEEGESYADRKDAFAGRAAVIDSLKFGLQVDPSILAQRIDERVDAMVEEGLIEEVRSLIDHGFREGLTAKQAIGYKELLAYLAGQMSLDEAICAIKGATRRLAKRQRTWFRRDPEIHWLNADDGDTEALSATIITAIDDAANGRRQRGDALR